jgi:hypothetical protein
MEAMIAATIGANALIPNFALKPLAFLIGRWRTEGSHPQLPGVTLQGVTAFEWHEGGAFIVMHSQVDHPEFPDGVAVIGSDSHGGRFAMTYFDERGISRLLDVEAGVRTVTWRRDDDKLAQSLTITAGDGPNQLVSRGRMSIERGPWGDDLSQVFTRL